MFTLFKTSRNNKEANRTQLRNKIPDHVILLKQLKQRQIKDQVNSEPDV